MRALLWKKTKLTLFWIPIAASSVRNESTSNAFQEENLPTIKPYNLTQNACQTRPSAASETSNSQMNSPPMKFSPRGFLTTLSVSTASIQNPWQHPPIPLFKPSSGTDSKSRQEARLILKSPYFPIKTGGINSTLGNWITLTTFLRRRGSFI